MKKVAGIFLTVLLVLCFVLSVPVTASAASADTQYGLQASIVTDKDEYKADEKIEVIFTVTNTSDSKVEGVTVEPKLSEGLILDSSDLTNKAIALNKDESYSAKMVLTTKKDLVDDTSKDDKTDDKKDDKKDNSKSPKTNDTSKVLLWIVFFVLSAVCIFVCIKYRKSVKVLSVILCIAMAVSMAPLSAFAAETKTNTFELDKTIKVDKKDYSISVNISVPNADDSVCVVTFDTVGGSAIEPVTVEKGSLVEIPETPTLENHLFVGWYIDADYSEEFDFDLPINSSCTLYARWVDISDATDTDKDGLTDPVEEFYGTDINNPDTDADGLSDCVEISVLHYNPLSVDTDSNGTNDGVEDFDKDGISNIDEVNIGSNPTLIDTDGDELEDKTEIDTYKTDPTLEDTDGDALCDSDELALGLDPLNPKTDGVTLDSERVFEQQLNKENIAAQLLEESNDAIPSLDMEATGNINSDVSITTTSNTEFGDSRAILGSPIEISGENVESGILSFVLNDAETTRLAVADTKEVFNTALVCKYNSDGSVDYLDTNFNESNNTLSAKIGSEGTYFVLDVQNLFDELGLSMPSVSDISILTDDVPDKDISEVSSNNQGNTSQRVSLDRKKQIAETNTAPADAKTEKVTTSAASGVMAQADVVFVIDTTGSMDDEIYNVKENMSYFVDVLKEKGVSAGLALIDYQDITWDGYDSTKVHKNGASNWFYDVESYKSAISSLYLGDGGDYEETAVDALETARLLDMRASAGKIFVLVTDADYKVDNRYGIPSMAAEIELLKNAGVTCAVVSPEGEKNSYNDLFTQTNGVWANIYGDFYTELTKLADKIGTDIVGDGYWIYLEGPVPVPVRLDEKPTPGSKVDTDKDGVYDIDELEGATPTGSIDLDELITKISKGAITGTDYGKVMMYKYKSSPVEENTDNDVVDDAVDEEPRVFNISDRILAMVEGLSYTNLKDYEGYTVGYAVDNGVDLKGISEKNVEYLRDAYIEYANNSGSGYWKDFWDSGLGSIALKFVRPGKNTALVYSLRGSEFDDDFLNDTTADVLLGAGLAEAQSTEAYIEYRNLASNRNYDYYVTGHSLGGRLAQDVLYRVYSANKGGWFVKGANIPTPVHAATFNALGYNAVDYLELLPVRKSYKNTLVNFYYPYDLVGGGLGASGVFIRPGTNVDLYGRNSKGDSLRSEEELNKFFKVRNSKFHGIKYFQNDWDMREDVAHSFPYWID